MSRPWSLEAFPSKVPSGRGAAQDTVFSEEARLEAFDKGYKDGWDDATAAHVEDQARITAEFANNLQAMTFTYHEARSAILAEMAPLLRGMVESVLPGAIGQALCAHLLERLTESASHLSEISIEIVVAPTNTARVTALLEGRITPPLRVSEEPSLGDGQAFLRFGKQEEMIDLDATLAQMRQSIDDFFTGAPDQVDADSLIVEERKHA